MDKLFAWTVHHTVAKSSGGTVRRKETGIVKARNASAARAILKNTVCTIFSSDLTVTEIPDNMTVYSICRVDTDIND